MTLKCEAVVRTVLMVTVAMVCGGGCHGSGNADFLSK